MLFSTGIFTAAQPRGPAGLSEPHSWGRAYPTVAVCAVRCLGTLLPLWLLRLPCCADPGHPAASGGPLHWWQRGLLAPQPACGVLEPDEADWAERGGLWSSAHPSHRRLSAPNRLPPLPPNICLGQQSVWRGSVRWVSQGLTVSPVFVAGWVLLHVQHNRYESGYRVMWSHCRPFRNIFLSNRSPATAENIPRCSHYFKKLICVFWLRSYCHFNFYILLF